MTQQQLEKEREQALNGHLHNTDTQSKHALNHVEHMATVQQLERRAQALAILASRTEAQRDAVMTEFDALHQQHNDLREHATRLQEERHALREESEDLHEQLLQAQDALDEARSYLDETKTSLDDVTTQRREINLDLYDAKASLIEGQQKIQDLEHALIYTRKELEEAVSQRNSLNVHVANVEHDLEVAKEQLQEAELRYSTLQGEQLATLSAEALPKHLKAQLQQLEARLERRTKEKENLIHDNKRLDTNMRLQEERLAEISEELEKAQRENEAMIEDCASTRESRDDALRQVEDMGVEIDAMDMEVQEAKARLAHVESSNQQQVHTLVLVLADAATRSQSMTNVLKTALERRNSAISTLSARINALVDENTRLVQITDAQVARQEEAGAESQYLRSHIAQLDADALIRDGDLRSFTLALAVSCQQQRHQRTFLQDFNNARQTMRSRIATLQQGLEDHRSRLALVMPELEALRTTGHESTQTFAMRERELQADISRLELSLGQLQSAHGQAGHDFAVVKAENDVLVVKVAQFEAEKERLSRELDTAVSQQNANKEDLHEQLESLAAERDALIQKYDSLVDEHRTSMQELSEAQQRLIDSQAAQQPLQARHDELTQQLAAVQAETSTQLNDLESKLAAALRHATQADAALEEASQAQRILEDELTRARQELQRQVDDLTTSHPSTEDMDELRASYTEQLIQAQSHLEEAKARAQDAAQKLDESNRLRMTLETQRREDQDRHLSSYGELETAHRTAQQELAAHCARLEEAQSVTAQQRIDLENLNQVVMRLSSESNNLRSSHQDLQNQLTQKCVILPAQSSL
jgi:chromosome segregation ATPase